MTLHCIVVTPEETAFEMDADSIIVPLFDGEKGVMTSHAPMIGRLGNGALTLTTGGTTESHYVEGGFIQVLDNVVSILTNRVAAIEDFNRDDLEVNLRDALAMPGNSVEQLDQREKVVDAVRSQLRMLNRS
ncbi:MAG: F0F1 ATP synthase subunit epsilon [Planctomycetaceae bacterium]|jgi:F-type H+-transporting ATPase subunit epsilon|nr:F0F1 ATP synthase subunit epsilon [Planctomycetaceae bacterium]